MDAGPVRARGRMGGPAASYMITFENGYTVYFSGSSAATLDMGMWGDWYKPDAAIIHISAAHNPVDAAMVGKLIGTNNPEPEDDLPASPSLAAAAGRIVPAVRSAVGARTDGRDRLISSSRTRSSPTR